MSSATFGGFDTAGGAVEYATVPAALQASVYLFVAGNVTFSIDASGFTDDFDRDFTIEVTQSTGSFASTRYRWSDDGGLNWNETEQTPVDGTPKSLTYGVTVTWDASGLSPEFVAGDVWEIRAHRRYGIALALDGSRSSDYRSGALPTSSTLSIGWDLGSALQPQFLAALDWNLPSNATTTLRAHGSTLFQEPAAFTHACTWRSGGVKELISPEAGYRYWWLRIVMGATALSTYLRISELFLGVGATFDKPPVIGFSDDRRLLGSLDITDVSTRGAGPQVHDAAMVQYTWPASGMDTNSDGGRLLAAWNARHVDYKTLPFWFVLYDDRPQDAVLYQWAADLRLPHAFLDNRVPSVQWTEVIRTVL